MLRRKVDCEYAKGLVQAYFAILTQGCGNSSCNNSVCRSNPAAPVLSPNDAAIQSIVLAVKSPVAICLSLPSSTSSFQQPNAPPSSSSCLELEVPETDDDNDDTKQAAPSTPRKRLTTAVLLDTSINVTPLRQARSVPKKAVASSMLDKNLRASSPMKHQRALDGP
ncbi:hypothetical protein H310_04602 [Aphanomyces invadans]|uniref:Ubiquitin-protein ligase E3A N-terminal zinc-binding domain-containing protein n=1 Tax=Aphanomyces invadans TaxID=157072 RepID=A0A024UCZ1_9STRA|nr:hypothetical protein H310_04602 [Aphanomyces invadans]ETW04281.1 hypothetical protein H310_04602 [Aphanomyces invadans]|eukprot:XP_008867237.1 hypothetical protein H310_04602 [Aphanomyces invadans]